MGYGSYVLISQMILIFLMEMRERQPLQRGIIFVKTMAIKGLFSIRNYHKCLIQLFPLHLKTYVMGLQPL